MKTNNQKEGFSLVEILVVITIIGIGLIGMMSFFNASLKSHADTENELIAAGLAQEGVELMRSLKDFRVLNGISWSQLYSSDPLELYRLRKCTRIDKESLTDSPRDCNNGNNNFICLLPDGTYRQCNGGVRTVMSRSIQVQSYTASALRVISTVTWNNRTATATDILYNNGY